ncbi:hypothetical protein LTR27_006863 [Elasticomyces elasticus]|nr:hypothetical protein LTR27_006863 [Elasticomyces elasticus]
MASSPAFAENMSDDEKMDKAVTAPSEQPLATDTSSSKSEMGDKKADEAETKKKAGLGDYFRVFRYTDKVDRVLYAIGFTCAIAAGATLPLMTLVFGSSTGSINNYASGQGDTEQFQQQIRKLVLWFVYLFVGRFVIGYVGTLS